MPPNTVLDQTRADLDGERVLVVSGTPVAGQFAAFTDATHVEGVPGGSGKVLQVVPFSTGEVATGTTVIPIDNSIPQQTEGDEYMTVSITPQDAGSQLRVDVVWNGTCSAASSNIIAALFQDATAGALAAVNNFNATGGGMCTLSFTHVMTAGTTAAITFKVRAGGQGGTVTFNGAAGARYLGGVFASSIVVTEIAP